MKRFLIFVLGSILLNSCSDPKKSNAHARILKQATQVYEKGEQLYEKEENENAFRVFNKSRDLYMEIQDTVDAARAMTQMAIIQEYSSDNLGSIETSFQALRLLKNFKNADKKLYWQLYNNLGVNFFSLNELEQAKTYYHTAATYNSDSLDAIKISHNLATTLFRQKRYKEALALQNKILGGLKKKDNVYYKISLNQSRTLSKENATYNPVPKFREALHFYKETENEWGLAAAYSYLSEYYKPQKMDSSGYYAQKLFQISGKLRSPHDQLEALTTLIEVSPEPKVFFKRYHEISDSLQNATNKSKNQYARVRYESEKNLNDKILLEKKIFTKNIFLYSGLGLLILTSGGGYIWFARRKREIILKADNQIKEERLGWSKKVHDIVANGLYQVMMTVEHQNNLDKEALLDQLDGMYQKSRDISHGKYNQFSFARFQETVSDLASDFQHPELRIFIAGNEQETWKRLPESSLEDVYLLIRELFVNMKKHSGATRAVLRFEILNGNFHVIYGDNGSGIPAEKVQNGLFTIRQAVEKHHGKLEISSSPTQKTKIDIFIPLS